MKGKVYLVGAGPGDPDLITKRGYDLLKEADVVVYDRLATSRLLEVTREDCDFIYVGKTAKNHTKTQDEINEIIYQEAKSGKTVLRLKGGDPYVFGRGGEEGEYLFDRGIEFEEVPGITSAIGGLAYAGIPITHRGVATSFHVITGHLKDDSEELNWEALSKLDGTLVFLMGVGNLEKIANNLMANGKDKNTRAALVNWGTRNYQRVVEGRLEDIYQVAKEAKIGSPSLIVVGDVIGLREKLNFHERKALFGKNIVVTRERKSALTTIKKLERLGANAISMPSIKIEKIENNRELESEIKNLGDYDYLTFTSVNAVNIFFESLFELGLDGRYIKDTKVVSIGSKTSEAIKRYGIIPDLMPEKFVAESLIEVLKRELKPSHRVLIPRGNLGRIKLVEELSECSDVVEVPVYRTVKDRDFDLDEIEKIRKLDDYYLLFTSSSTVTNFREIIGSENEDLIEKGKILSIGPITTERLKEYGYDIYLEAEEYTIDGVIEALIREEENE